MALTDKLTAIANAIRAKTGKTEPLTLDAMPGEIEGISAGGGSGIDVPKLAVAHFPVSLSMSENTGQIKVDFSKLFEYMDGDKTYAYSFILHKDSVTEYTDLRYVAISLYIGGRVGHGGKSVGTFAFDANSAVLLRTSSESMGSKVQLNAFTNTFSAKSMSNGLATMTLQTNLNTDIIGNWTGMFTVIAPYTSAEPTKKIVECPSDFLTFVEVS